MGRGGEDDVCAQDKNRPRRMELACDDYDVRWGEAGIISEGAEGCTTRAVERGSFEEVDDYYGGRD